MIPQLKDLSLKGQRVLIRVDFNVPMTKEGAISDDSRIRAAMPTIQYVIDAGGKAIFMSHLGRPKGRHPLMQPQAMRGEAFKPDTQTRSVCSRLCRRYRCRGRRPDEGGRHPALGEPPFLRC